jgi:hypothetical protein
MPVYQSNNRITSNIFFRTPKFFRWQIVWSVKLIKSVLLSYQSNYKGLVFLEEQFKLFYRHFIGIGDLLSAVNQYQLCFTTHNKMN